MINQFGFLSFRTWNLSIQRELGSHVYAISLSPPTPTTFLNRVVDCGPEKLNDLFKLQSDLIAIFGPALKNTEKDKTVI